MSGKKKGLLVGNPPPEEEEVQTPDEETPEELDERFEFHNPVCNKCGSNEYSACNVNQEGEVVSCDKCPITGWLH